MRNLALASCLLLAALAARAETPPAPAPAPEAPDVIVPLNVRDPSALVMGPPGQAAAADVTVLPPQRAAEPAREAKNAKTASDKTPLAPRKRAVTISVDEEQLLSVKPGDRVDVVAVFDAASSAGARRSYAATMLQNERVLAVTTTGDLHGKGALTLELNPNEAQYALLTARRTELGVSVRAPGDVEIYPMEMAIFGKLFR